MLFIPVNDVYAQTFQVQLDGQACVVNLYQKSTGMFCDLLLDGAVICTGVPCQNLNRIVRAAYSGFVGDLMWMDIAGSNDPSSPGLGFRYLFCYLEAADVAAVNDALASIEGTGTTSSEAHVPVTGPITIAALFVTDAADAITFSTIVRTGVLIAAVDGADKAVIFTLSTIGSVVTTDSADVAAIGTLLIPYARFNGLANSQYLLPSIGGL